METHKEVFVSFPGSEKIIQGELILDKIREYPGMVKVKVAGMKMILPTCMVLQQLQTK